MNMHFRMALAVLGRIVPAMPGRIVLAMPGIGAAALAGCVTINIYFPAAAAEKAADKIIDEVWQIQNGAAKPAAPPAAGEKK